MLVLAAGLATQPQPSTPAEMWDAWCARCHAPDGSGRVAQPTISVEPMDFSDCKVASPEPDADWELAIAQGGPAVGLSSEMPAFGDTLSSEQVQGLVHHMRGFCKEPNWPNGNVNFPRPIFTEKAFPENELVILPMLTRRTLDVGGSTGARATADRSLSNFDLLAIFERRFGKRAMWEVSLPVASHDTTGTTRRQGIGDIEVAVKYAIADRESSPAILSGGFEIAFPTGSEVRGLGRGTIVLEPYLAAGMLARNIYLQAQAKYELPTDRSQADTAFVYNLYAGGDTSIAPTTWTLGVELNGENTELALTPQVRKGLTKTGALAAAVGVRIPVTDRHEQGTRLVGYLLWEYLEPVRARP